MYILFALFFTILCSTQAVEKYNVHQIKNKIDSTLNCLETFTHFTSNSSIYLAAALSNIHDTLINVPKLSKQHKNDIKSIEKRIEKLIEESFIDNSNDPSKYTWRSIYWSYLIDYWFKEGLITKQPLLNKTLHEIIKDSEEGPKYVDCLLDIIVNNVQSNSWRKCKVKCQQEMDAEDYDYHINSMNRMYYFGVMAVNNCSNLTPNEYRRKFLHFCSYIKREVDTMLLYKDEDLFSDTIYYFLKKVVYCSKQGISEFLSKDIVSTVINLLDCNNCVSNEKYGTETQLTLTAMILSILISVYRRTFEEHLY